jgi:hypothetical protein
MGNLMKKLIKRWFGIDKLEAEKTQAQEALANAQAETIKAQELEAQAKMTPKERATRKGEAWVAVLDTKINKDNVRNGFFELDWNDHFITELKKSGYGFDGDPEEEIVDRWFRDLARNMLSEEGIDNNRGAGYINVTKLADGKAQVE